MKIVILGSSAAGAKIIEEVRKNDPSHEITVISFDGHYPNMRDAYAPFIANEITPEKVFTRSKGFYEQNHAQVLFDKKITRINVKRKKIFTEDQEPIDYDVLVITDTPENRFPDIKGTNKQNIFGYKKLKDIDTIVNALPLVKTVVIQSDRFAGLQAAASFIKREKEVILVSSEDNFLAQHFDATAAAWLMAKFEEKGLRILVGNPIAEILGDKDAKAVRLKSGKVFSAEIILFMETEEDLRLFAGSGIPMGQKIDVDQDFKAGGAEGLFVVDQPCSFSDAEPVTPLPVLEEQGKKVAAAISGREYNFNLPACVRNFGMDGIRITVLGETTEKDGVTVRQNFDPETGRYKRFYSENNCLVGAVLLNSDDEQSELLRQINEKCVFSFNDGASQLIAVAEGNEGNVAKAGNENVSTELVDN